uniref:Uncharacterized protein n=1 Tax=Rhodnius prolixus TaxID=13249 RepID=T1HKK3_RHOPR
MWNILNHNLLHLQIIQIIGYILMPDFLLPHIITFIILVEKISRIIPDIAIGPNDV